MSTAISRPTGIWPMKIPMSCFSSATTSTNHRGEQADRAPAQRRREATTLPRYRNRYAQYRLDPDLQSLHAQVPALVTWDDHEVAERLRRPMVAKVRRSGALPVAPRRRLPGVLRAHAGAADPVASARAGDAGLRPFHLRRPGRDFHDRRSAVSLARSLLRPAEQGRRPSGKQSQLPGAARSRPHHDRLRAGSLALFDGSRTRRRNGT